MTLVLNKIELNNFRSHEHFIFEPKVDGITAISGKNGAGKSTIVDAFAWALYGTRPSKVTNKMLIREGIEVKNHEPQVTVDLEINKISYRIVRRIVSQSGAADCNVYSKQANGEYNILAGPSVTSAEAYIKQIMGMDEKGFLTSVLIQQKQVDQIVSASPRERAQVIEKLTGISSITEALDLSKEELKAYKKAADVITVKDSNEIKEEMDKVINDGNSIKISVTKLVKTIKDNKAKLTEDQAKYQIEVDNYTKNKDLTQQLQLVHQQQKSLGDEAKRITEYLMKFKKDNDKTMVIEDPKPLEKKQKDITVEIINLDNEIKKLNSTVNRGQGQLDSNADFMKDNKFYKRSLASLEKKISQAKEDLTSAQEQHQIAVANVKQVKKSIETLTTGDMVCPVCKRPIDDPKQLKKELNSELAANNKISKETHNKVKKINDTITQYDKDIDNMQSIAKRMEELKVVKDELPKYKKDLAKLQSDIIELRAKDKLISAEYDKAMKQFLYKEDIENKKARIKEINEEFGNVNKQVEEINKEIESIHALKKTELTSMKRDIDALSKKYNEDVITYNNQKSQYTYLKQRYADLDKQYKDAVEAQEKYNELTSKIKLSAVTENLMNEFKSDRIKYAVPTIELYASNVLAQFTDNKFTRLKLDSKFNTSVITASGEERPIAQLSGGELSAAAIALRLSISMLLNGAGRNVIIFDEVLVSMDEVRARKIMETISEITNSQIIFIAHNSDIDSIADLVIQVGHTDEEE